MDFCYVLFCEFVGQKLEGYNKSEVIYESLSFDDVCDMEKCGDIDCWVMVFFNGVCKFFVEVVYEGCKGFNYKSVIVDFFVDYCFDNLWIYGFFEFVQRNNIVDVIQIVNFGCYVIVVQFGIVFFVEYFGGMFYIFGVFGYFGVGIKFFFKNDVDNFINNFIFYSLIGYIYECEVSSQFGVQVVFIFYVVVWFCGIYYIIFIFFKQSMILCDICQIYQDRYVGEKFVKVVGEVFFVKNISGKYGVEIGGFEVDKIGKCVVVCVIIDNFFKGVVIQCLCKFIYFGLFIGF